MSRMQSAILPAALISSLIVAALAFILPSQAGQTVSSNSSNLPADQPAAASLTIPEGECLVSQKFPEAILYWCTLISRYAVEVDLEPDLVAALMLQESGGIVDAYSSNGAVGLLQVMPRDGLAADFMCANGPCFASRPTISELLEPEFNLAYGTRLLAGLVETRGSLRDALLHYGPIDVEYAYADTVIRIWERYR